MLETCLYSEAIGNLRRVLGEGGEELRDERVMGGLYKAVAVKGPG